MARMRTLKPGFFTSEDIAKYPLRARHTFAGLWCYCDDHGRGKDNVRLIKAAVWPLDDDVSLEDIDEDLRLLHEGGAIVRFRSGGAGFVAVQRWHFHQSPNRPSETQIPDPPVPIAVPAPGKRNHCEPCWVIHERLSEPSLIPHGMLSELSPGYPQSAGQPFSEHSLNAHEQLIAGMGGKGREKEGGGGTRERDTPPPGSRPRCQRHAHLPDDDPGPNCIGCRDARLAAEKRATAVPAKPEWCGECDENTRQVEREDGIGRCRVCHPLRSVS